jgi:cation diffusion facilitator family transporter
MTRAERTTLVSAALATSLSAGFIVAAISVGSISLFAGGMITLARGLTSLMLFAGMRLSLRHPDDFPSGLYKLENLMATALGVMILVAAYVLAKVSIHDIVHQGNLIGVDDPLDALIPLLVCMFLALFMAWYKVKVSREENSPSLRADARFSMADAIGLAIISAGICLEAAGVPDMDAWAALVVSVIVAWVGIVVALDGIKVLLDASVEKDVLEKVRAIAQADRRVREVVAVQGRNSGSYRFINLEVELDTYDLREAAAITGNIKDDIRAEIENVDQIIVDFAVEAGEKLLCAVALEADNETMAAGFEDAPRYALVEVDGSGETASAIEILANPFGPEDKGAGVSLAVFLALRGAGALLLRRSPRSATAPDVLDAYEVRMLIEPELARVGEARAYLAAHAAELVGGGGAG